MPPPRAGLEVGVGVRASQAHLQGQTCRRPLCAHTHSHLGTCSHTCAPMHGCTHLCPCSHTCAHVCITGTEPVHTYGCAYLHTCTRTQLCMHSHAHARIHTLHLCTQPPIQICACTHAVAHTHTWACAHRPTYTLVHTHTRPHTRARPGLPGPHLQAQTCPERAHGEGPSAPGALGGGQREPRALWRPLPGTHREAPRRVHFDHTAQQALAVGRDEVRHVEHAPFHLLQQLPQVVVVEGQRPLPVGDGVTAGRRDRVGRGGDGRRGGVHSHTALHALSGRGAHHQQREQDHAAAPHVRLAAVVLLPLRRAVRLADAGPGSSRGSRGPGGGSPRESAPPTGREGLGSVVATYPNHLGAGIVGGPEGESSSQGTGSGLAICPAMIPGLPPGPHGGGGDTERGCLRLGRGPRCGALRPPRSLRDSGATPHPMPGGDTGLGARGLCHIPGCTRRRTSEERHRDGVGSQPGTTAERAEGAGAPAPRAGSHRDRTHPLSGPYIGASARNRPKDPACSLGCGGCGAAWLGDRRDHSRPPRGWTAAAVLSRLRACAEPAAAGRGRPLTRSWSPAGCPPPAGRPCRSPRCGCCSSRPAAGFLVSDPCGWKRRGGG